MSIVDNINYSIYKATYNPEAEAHAKEQAEANQRAKNTQAEADARAAERAKFESDKAAAEKLEQEKKDRETFSGSRLAGRIFKIIGYMVLFFVLFVLAILGASFSANLNLYRELPYRILCALYGFGFFFIVIPYVAGYRWFWMGIEPRFYGVIPLLPYRFDHPLAEFLFGWMSYRPDERIELLRY
jgi:hypothetical protein